MPNVDQGLFAGEWARHKRSWELRHVGLLVVVDAVAVATSVSAAFVTRFGVTDPNVGGVSYILAAFVMCAGWLVALYRSGAYETRFLGVGGEEFKRVVRASLWLAGAVAVISYIGHINLARGYVAGAVPLGIFFLLLCRYILRHRLQRMRRRGHCKHKVLVIGSRISARELIQQMRSAPYAGFQVIGACVDDPSDEPVDPGIPTLGLSGDAAEAADRGDADVVAVSASHILTPDQVRELGWKLEGSHRDLVLRPALTDIAGPRLSVRPVVGLPLLYVDEAKLTGMTRVVKRALDVSGSLLLLIVSSPLLILTAITVRATSEGPALFRQRRVGQHGATFQVFKFRSMYADAEQWRAELAKQSDGDGLLFKLRKDPRVTPVGNWIRRFSVDELPQLFNVLRGEMSLVGPRPLPVDDEDFRGDERRRLLVRPGITGLWQVHGRSDNSWRQTVRLDSYYVENWSLSLDLVILIRTVLVVIRGVGAY